jgi:hypothetical protein
METLLKMLGLRSSKRAEAQQKPSQPKKYDRGEFVWHTLARPSI